MYHCTKAETQQKQEYDWFFYLSILLHLFRSFPWIVIAGYTCKSGPRGGYHPRDSWAEHARSDLQIIRTTGILLLSFPLLSCVSPTPYPLPLIPLGYCVYVHFRSEVLADLQKIDLKIIMKLLKPIRMIKSYFKSYYIMINIEYIKNIINSGNTH